MNIQQIEQFRRYYDLMKPQDKTYKVVIPNYNGTSRDLVKAFDLPLDRAKEWSKWWPGSEIVENK